MLRASVIVGVLLALCAAWILFYDGPPPDDGKMLPQWTPQDPGKPNPLVTFTGALVPAAFDAYSKLSQDARKRLPGTEPEQREYLAKSQVNCDAFDKLMLTDIRTWRWPGGERLVDSGFSSEIGSFGGMAQTMRLRIHLLKVDGKIEEAVERSLDLVRFGAGQQLAEGMLVHQLVGQTCQRLGEDALQEVLTNVPASPALITKTLRQMETIPSPSRKGCQFAYMTEYLFFKNQTKNLGRGASGAPGTVPITTVLHNKVSALFFKRNRTLSTYLDLGLPVVEALDRSWPEAFAATEASRDFAADYELNKNRPTRYLDSNFVGTMLLAMSVEGSDRIVEKAMFVDSLKRQSELMLALRLFELERSTLPSKLEELVPAYLPAVPEDVFTGKSMLWDSVREVVYSVGPNGVDDGGRIDLAKPHKGADVGMRYWWSKASAEPAAPAENP